MAQKRRYVYGFGGRKADGTAAMKALLGGKGANLAEMTNIGMPVPPGFTITTEVCTHYYSGRQRYPAGLRSEVDAALSKLERLAGKKFGDTNNPLLVSVRSGARASMPGMMDTILNLGLNDRSVEGLARISGNPRFAYDSYRRLIQMYGDVVLGLKPVDDQSHDPFEEILDRVKRRNKVEADTELTEADLRAIAGEFKELIKQRVGKEFPQDPHDQLWGAVGAVFGSWMNDRAIAYRKLNGIPQEWGTAVNVQAMVFGNLGGDSGTGVAFTRNPSTGQNEFYGEFLFNAQGEDVVAGIRTPMPVASVAATYPHIYEQLLKVRARLEKHYRDMQDIEFTFEKGRLYMLQTRAGKRTGFAAVKVAVDMVEEKLITPKEALLRIGAEQLNQLLRPVFDAAEKERALGEGRLLARGLNAGPGAATGRAVFSAPRAEQWKARGEQVILVRMETSPEDIRGMDASEGILTARGGMTSHAALVARQMGKVCVAGCGALDVDYAQRQLRVDGRVIAEGDDLSIDGSTGEVITGKITTRPSDIVRMLVGGEAGLADSETVRTYRRLMEWSDAFRKLKVRTNADQPDQCETAIAFGAEGIGLCRTEHMFFGGDRIDSVREMILADDEAGRRHALAKLLPMQREDFVGIFRVMSGKPVTIRTLDPPLHEFLPHDEKGIAAMAGKLGLPPEKVAHRIQMLQEFNPMLGNRGCRLGIVFPEITEMQSRAIFEAACDAKLQGFDVRVEVMIPLVGFVKELKEEERIVRRVAKEVFAARGTSVNYVVGTMIELPRAAVTAGEIASVAEFFSFGTNDLTQTTLGLSRDDAGTFLPQYLDAGIFDEDPFQTIDREGVGRLMEFAVRAGRAVKGDLKIGICGEHGGEPKSVEYCHGLGLDYVSCSPYRIPIARLAAAQAALREQEEKAGRSGAPDGPGRPGRRGSNGKAGGPKPRRASRNGKRKSRTTGRA